MSVKPGVLPRLDRSQFVGVYLTLERDTDKICNEPPIFDYDDIADDVERAEMRLKLRQYAGNWDIYKNVVQLSFLHEGAYKHFMLCATDELRKSTDTTIVCATEAELMRCAVDHLWSIYGAENEDGTPLLNRYLAGWRTHSIIWPAIVSRAIKYRLHLPRAMLTDPEKRWPTIYKLLDVSCIYTQAGGTQWKMPSLPDLLKYWGVTDTLKAFPSDIAKLACTDPVFAGACVEPYLKGMLDLLELYYAGNSATTDTSNTEQFAAVPDYNALLQSMQPKEGERR